MRNCKSRIWNAKNQKHILCLFSSGIEISKGQFSQLPKIENNHLEQITVEDRTHLQVQNITVLTNFMHTQIYKTEVHRAYSMHRQYSVTSLTIIAYNDE